MSEKNLTICDYRNKILNGLDALENLRQIVITKNKLARIILEETVYVYWNDIKKSNKVIQKILPTLQNTLIWNISYIKDLVNLIQNNFNIKILQSPCSYVDFLELLLHKDSIKEDIEFLKHVFSDNTRCSRVFRKIN